MKQILAILLLTGVLMQSMSKYLVELNYMVNRDYIAKNLCENRDKPQMKCCGKCHLNKQLNKTENDNSKNKTTQRFAGFDFFAGDRFEHFSAKQYFPSFIKTVTGLVATQYAYRPLTGVFHPPQA